MNAHHEFERTIAALGKVADQPTASMPHNVLQLRPEPADHDQSLRAELRSSILLLLTVLVPILMVALTVG